MENQRTEAVQLARRVIGLYGDPTVSWSIVLRVRLTEPCSPTEVAERARRMVADHPHLGAEPVVETIDRSEEERTLSRFADRPYDDDSPLVRLALVDHGRSLIVAAHHGAVDGLGLLGVIAALTSSTIVSSAHGIEREREPDTFWRRSMGRLVGALAAPPRRITGDRPGLQAAERPNGDWLIARSVRTERPSSAALVGTASQAARLWNQGRRRVGRRSIIAMGISRRAGSPTPTPTRDTAYVRLPVDDVTTVEQAHQVIVETIPEPAFPVTEGTGIGPLVIRLLAGRLGATMLVSNLGRIDGPGIAEVAFWPVPTGPYGVCLGLASAGERTVLTLRARRGWFTEAAGRAFMDLAADLFVGFAR